MKPNVADNKKLLNECPPAEFSKDFESTEGSESSGSVFWMSIKSS